MFGPRCGTGGLNIGRRWTHQPLQWPLFISQASPSPVKPREGKWSMGPPCAAHQGLVRYHPSVCGTVRLIAFGKFCQVLQNLNTEGDKGKVLFSQDLLLSGEKSYENISIRWLNYKQSSSLFSLHMYNHEPPLKCEGLVTFCVVTFIRNIPFPRKTFFFCAYVAVVPPSAGMSVVCVCTQGFWSFRPLALLLCRPSSLPRSPLFSSCVVSEHVSCIHPGSFHGSPPLHINIVCWTGISGRSCVETWEYLLFKGLVPYAVLVRGGAKVCVLVEEDAGLTQCHWQGELQNPTVDFPPHYLFQSRKAQARSHRSSVLSVCVECVSLLGICAACACVRDRDARTCSLHETAHICGVLAIVWCVCMYTFS